jgi:hypothetical protein
MGSLHAANHDSVWHLQSFNSCAFGQPYGEEQVVGTRREGQLSLDGPLASRQLAVFGSSRLAVRILHPEVRPPPTK